LARKLKLRGERREANLRLELAHPTAFTTVANILRSTQVVHGSVPLRSTKPDDIEFRVSPK